MTWTFKKTRVGPSTARGVGIQAHVRAGKAPRGAPFASRSRVPFTFAFFAHPPYALAQNVRAALNAVSAGLNHKRV